MKVLLISSASVGPLYISSLLKKHGFEVKRLPQGFKRCLGERAEPFSAPLSEEEFNLFAPDVVGFSTDSSTFSEAVHMAGEMKSLRPATKIIFGGAHVTDCPDVSIQCAPIDAICVGEGEYPMLEYCEALKKGEAHLTIKNLWVKHRGEVIKNEERLYLQDLDSIPLDRDGIFYGGVYSGRGCVGRCSFCNVPSVRQSGKGRYFRKRKIKNVLDEVAVVYREINSRRIKRLPINVAKMIMGRRYSFDPDPLRFKDDTFLADRKWFLEFAPRLRERFPRLKYICQARANEINKEVADWLAKSGCVMVSLGFETGNENLRNNVLHKNITNDQISRACGFLRERGIKIMGQWIYGMPGETLYDSLKTFVMSVKEGDLPQLHFMSPLPNTELFNIAVQKGLLRSDYMPKGLYDSELIFHTKEQRTQMLIISLLHVLKDVRIPNNYEFVRYLGTKQEWRGRKVGEVFASELESTINWTFAKLG